MDASKKYLFSGQGFGKQGPYLILDTIISAKKERLQLYIINKTFTLQRFRDRYCIGQFSLKTFETLPCPSTEKIDQEFDTCPRCRKANGFNPAFYNTSADRISPQQLEYNRRPHAVYLAYFGTRVLKVGIACLDRITQRLLEQGARAATIVKKCPDAYEARKIEKEVREILGVSEWVKTDKKIQLLGQHFSHKDAQKDIDFLKSNIARELMIEVEDEEIFDFTGSYIKDNQLNPDMIDLSKERPQIISGRGVGIVGDILIMEQGGLQFVTTLKNYLAHVVSISSFEKENSFTVKPKQLTLF